MTPQGELPERQYALHPVSVPGFEGPLDLLLSLIEEEKLDISQISLATVTDQYLGRLQSGESLPAEHLADFLVVAATLLLLKSKRLFPDLALTEEEEQQVASLEEQLREYQKFRAAAKQFQTLWGRNITLWPRESFQGVRAAFYPPPGLRTTELRGALDLVLTHLPTFTLLAEEVVRRVVSIEERIRAIQARIQDRAQATFRELADGASNKLELIVSFLALLELVKQRMVHAEQAESFRDILVRPHAGPDAAPVSPEEFVL